MNIVKQIIKYMLIMVVMVGLGYLIRGIYLNFPSGTDVRLSEGPTEVLAELSAMGDETPINPDLYAASTYRPEHPLYQAILAVQQKHWFKAQRLLKPFVDKGNAEAMFWYGELTYSSNAFSRGGQWFEKAAKLGNPYAAMKLAPQYNISIDCQYWLGTYCDEQWGVKGLNILKERADKGDVKAAYAYLYYTQFEDNSLEYLDKLVAVVKAGVKQHYYRPLRHLVRRYTHRRNLSPFKRYDLIPLSQEEKLILTNVLMIAVNNNDLPSLNLMNEEESTGIKPALPVYNQAVHRMLPISYLQSSPLFFDYFAYEAKRNVLRKVVIEGYAYALILGSYSEEYGDRFPRIYQGKLEERHVSPLSDKEKEMGEQLFEQYKKQYSPIVYIDEIQGAWGADLFS
ncbi:SEL1-like repeat protein [Vibrio alginolyticus]|uniref:hypothetical protein n=1 Tax=Vibrio alginolyticus TaxID=663 RepID=UPI002119FEAE|nr:hypothetical protein [Vibrio alginolyticus]MCQ9087124.1 hypothetical protein [Vibrio alginolyticus]